MSGIDDFNDNSSSEEENNIHCKKKFKKKKAVHSPEDSKSKNKIRKNQNVDPILIFSSASNKNLFDRSDFLKFDEKIQNISNA